MLKFGRKCLTPEDIQKIREDAMRSYQRAYRGQDIAGDKIKNV